MSMNRKGTHAHQTKTSCLLPLDPDSDDGSAARSPCVEPSPFLFYVVLAYVTKVV